MGTERRVYLEEAFTCLNSAEPGLPDAAAFWLAEAQVHATLDLSAGVWRLVELLEARNG